MLGTHAEAVRLRRTVQTLAAGNIEPVAAQTASTKTDLDQVVISGSVDSDLTAGATDNRSSPIGGARAATVRGARLCHAYRYAGNDGAAWRWSQIATPATPATPHGARSASCEPCHATIRHQR